MEILGFKIMARIKEMFENNSKLGLGFKIGIIESISKMQKMFDNEYN